MFLRSWKQQPMANWSHFLRFYSLALALASTSVVVVAVTVMVVELMVRIGHRLPLMPYTLLAFLDRVVYPSAYVFG